MLNLCEKSVNINQRTYTIEIFSKNFQHSKIDDSLCSLIFLYFYNSTKMCCTMINFIERENDNYPLDYDRNNRDIPYVQIMSLLSYALSDLYICINIICILYSHYIPSTNTYFTLHSFMIKVQIFSI